MRGNWRFGRHLASISLGFCRNYAALRLRTILRAGRPAVIIALVEHMGDIVAAEPVSRYVKGRFPDADVVWILRKPYKELVKTYASVDRVLTVTCFTEWLLLWASRPADVVWDLHISERFCPKCGITHRKPPPADALNPETYYHFGNLLTVNCLCSGIPVLRDGPIITPKRSTMRKVDKLDLPQRFVVVHAQSNESSRDWALDKWRDLVEWIANERGVNVLEIGNEPYVIQRNAGGMRSLCGSLSLMESAEVIRRGALFVGIDSGPAHLANAVGTPGIILLGRYRSFQSYTPYSGNYAGEGADLIRSEGPAQTIPLQAVLSAVAHRLAPYGSQPPSA